jgi:hypothetical protein
VIACCFSIALFALAQDVASGPEEGKKVPALKVYAISGPVEKETLDYAQKRGDKATVYVIVPHDKFSRPMHRFLLELGKVLPKAQKDALVVSVWLTDDPNKTKDYLPKIAQYYEATALACYEGEKAGPEGWNINDRADITVVVCDRGNVIRSLGYNSVNETVAKEVVDLFKK